MFTSLASERGPHIVAMKPPSMGELQGPWHQRPRPKIGFKILNVFFTNICQRF